MFARCGLSSSAGMSCGTAIVCSTQYDSLSPAGAVPGSKSPLLAAAVHAAGVHASESADVVAFAPKEAIASEKAAQESQKAAGNPWPGQLAAGGLSCMTVSFILNPMDVVKVRMQTQNELSKADPSTPKRYTSFRQAFQKIAREEGLAGLTKGWQPSMLREASYSSLRMGLYQPIRDALSHGEEEISLGNKIIASMTSGALGSVIANPTDLVKIRFQCELPDQKPRYRGTMHAFAEIARTEGVANGLYRGAAATTLRAAVLTAGQLASYDHTKHTLVKNMGYEDGFGVHLIASLVAGLTATTASSPVDVIKTRYMNSQKAATTGGSPLYSSPLDCFIKTVRHDGVLSLFRGWVPNYLRLGPHFIVSLPLYEQLRKLFGVGYLS